MQIYRKTRHGFGSTLRNLSIKISIFAVVLIIIIFLISKLDLPAPNKSIKLKIPNEKFKVIK